MKMLMIVFRQSIVERIHALLKEYDVSAFPELNNNSRQRGDRVSRLISPVIGRQRYDPHRSTGTACLPPHRWVDAL